MSNDNPTKAVILAGGKGVRLRPFTVNFPKPLVPLGDKPIIEVLIHRLIECGIRDITLTLGFHSALVRAYFDQRKELTQQLNLRFVDEVNPTGTAGSLASVSGLDNTFLVMNGDLLTDIDFNELLVFHRKQGSILTIATHQRTSKVDLGVLDYDEHFCITEYREKPESTYSVSMGIYVYEPKVLDFITPSRYLDFPDLVLKLLQEGERVSAFPSSCQWLDIGRPDDYAKAQEIFAKGEFNA